MAFVAPILGNIALNLAIGVGASVLSSVLAPKKKTQSVTTSKGFTFEVAVGESVPVSVIFGRARSAGQLIYVNEYGDDNEYLQLVIKNGYGECEGLHKALVDEKEVTLVGSNSDPKGWSVAEFTRSGTPYLWFKTYNGAPGQVADPELVAHGATRWTSAHKMTGCAYTIITVRYDPDFYGSALPSFGTVWNGVKLFDFREESCVWGDPSTYIWTANPAVIKYNFRRGIYVNGVRVLGQGFSSHSCDLGYYIAAANICDEEVDYPDFATLPRYAYGREVGDDEEKLAVLTELDDSMCGSSFKRGGADAPLPAATMVSVMTLNDSDRLRGYPVRADRRGSVSQKKTYWHGQYISSDSNWNLAPFVARVNTSLETTLNGRRATSLDQPYEWEQARAQSRAEIRLRRQMYPAIREETFTPKANRLEPGDAVTRVCEWGSMLMIVEEVTPLEDRTGVTIRFSQWSNFIVPASGEEFVTSPEEPGAAPSPATRTIAVSGLSVVPYLRDSGGNKFPYLKATWTPITDPGVDQVMIRIWPTDGTEEDDGQDFFADSKLTSTKLLGVLPSNTEYTGYAIPIRSDGRVTVKTSNFTPVTTDEFTVPAEVPPITPEMLGAELSADHGFINDQGADGLRERLDEWRVAMDELAGAVTTANMTTNRVRELVEARYGNSTAAVLTESLTRASETAALAVQITEVLASVDEVIADGYLRFEAAVDGGGALATITAKVKASFGAAFSQAGWILRAEADGLGGTDAYFGVLGTFHVFETVDGSPIPVFSASADGALFNKLSSFATVGSTRIVVIDGDTGAFSITVP